MKKIVLLFVLTAGIALAQYTTPGTGVDWGLDDLVTNSGGVVTGSGNLYEVNQLVTVSVTDKITVPAGVTVKFTTADAGFEMDGSFSAIGTESAQILFTSDVHDSTGAYEGFRFNDTAVDEDCRFEYVRVEYAYYGMRAVSASPEANYSHFYKCRRGVNLSSSDAVIKNSVIERSYEYGINMTLGSNALIENNVIKFNNTQNTSAKNQVSVGLQGNNSPIIKNNKIYGGESTVTGGVSIWVSGSSNFSNAEVIGNEIYNNSFGITLYSSSNGNVNVLVKGNYIHDNNVNPNTLISGSGINLNGSPFNQPVITWNKITGNWWGITIQNGTSIQAGPQPNLGNVVNADTSDNGNNIIMNNIQDGTVYDLYNNCTNDVYAQNNDWGVYDSTSIEEHVFHKVDDPAHGTVFFMPYSEEIIPVELVSFSANRVGETVVLDWATATETNNMGFEIERKSGATFVKLGFVDGYGSTTEKQSYSYTDNSPVAGTVVYRLKQVDLDGTFTYSGELTVEGVVPVEYSLSQNYPNPFNPTTVINFSLPEASRVELTVFNLLGEKVSSLVSGIKEAGVHNISFDASGFNSGIYIYKLEAGNFVSVKKMMLVK